MKGIVYVDIYCFNSKYYFAYLPVLLFQKFVFFFYYAWIMIQTTLQKRLWSRAEIKRMKHVYRTFCYERKPMNGWISRVKATRSDEAAWSSVAHIESYSQPKSAHECNGMRITIDFPTTCTELQTSQNSEIFFDFEILNF